MSTLQISLAVVGVILLGLIVAYNAWNYRRHAPKRPQPVDSEKSQLESADRFEPGMDGLDITSMPQPAPAVDEPQMDAIVPEQDAAESVDAIAEGEQPTQDSEALDQAVHTAQTSGERKPALDALIDAIAPIRMDHPVSGEAALQVQPTTRRAGSKPFRIEGLNEASQEWEAVHAGQRYTAFQAGVQLANRLGALNEIEFSEFVSKAQSFADALNGVVELPDMPHEVSRARELDQFASEHDAQLSFVLRPRRATWSPGYIEQHATSLGFVASHMPGRLLLPSAAGVQPALLTLAYDAQAAQADNLDQTAVHEVWLSLDVPQVPRSEEPFARLRQVLQALCESMEGFVCDQNGYQLLPQVFDPIAADLQKLYDRLDQRELSAGSMLARRLFN